MIRFIADVGSNHNRSLERTVRLIQAAKEIGCDAVKFQAFDERLSRDPRTKAVLRERQLPLKFLPQIQAECKRLKIQLHCSVFHPDFVPALEPFVDEFKVGSYEILWLDLIKKCCDTGKPLGISCGGATMDEIGEALAVTNVKEQPPRTLYHCIPQYPANPIETELYRIHGLWHNFRGYSRLHFGYSDHTVCPQVMFSVMRAFDCLISSYRFGPREISIEFHLDLNDEKGFEFKHGHCWTPKEETIRMIAKMQQMHESIYDQSIFENENYREMRANRTDPLSGSRP